MNKVTFTLLVSILFNVVLNPMAANAQSTPFGVYVEPMAIPGLPGLQSYAYGTHHGKWLIVGGRTDGLHQRQPFAAFAASENNNNLLVVDPIAAQYWTAPLSSLPTALQEQLSSTNIEFYQTDTTLYCIGGYGYSATAGDHITYSNIVAINVPEVINAVIAGTPVSSFFRYQSDPQFAVTGGHLEKVYDTYYLIGGNKFDGRYNPMGGGSYTQVYTNQIRKFKISDDGTTMSITHLTPHTDAAGLHRRDYNATPQIMPDGKQGITAFSGVFQATVDLPFLNCVNIDSSGYVVNSSFSQYYNHYHCANLPVYSASDNEMHNIFFGGIAQYFDSAGVLVQDDAVPFVKTIARVTRVADGTMTEYKLPMEMPGLLGASAELIHDEAVPSYANHVLKLDEITADTTLAGYIYGGINSSAPNIFFINTGTQSTAHNQILKVYLVKNAATATPQINPQSTNNIRMQLYPNPNSGKIFVSFYTANADGVSITVTDLQGKVLVHEQPSNLLPGENTVSLKDKSIGKAGVYFVTVRTTAAQSTQKLIIN